MRAKNSWRGSSVFYFFFSNNVTKQPDGMGQLAIYCSSVALLTAPPSQTHAIKIPIFRLAQMVGGVIALFEVCYWDTFFIFFHAFVRSFHTSDIELGDIPLSSD